MNTTLTVGARLSALFFILLFCSTTYAGSAKVDVCHIPPDDPESFHTIRIDENALSAHLAHGDFASACNALCATICDDGNACTVDDTMDCEEHGCPAFPRETVDCSDELACTDDSCDVVNGCGNEPVECVPSDLCHVSICAESDGECSETPVVCGTDEVCDLDTGDCVPPSFCPCFTLDDLQAGGSIAECGENFPEFPDLAGALYTSGDVACSGINCADESGTAGCAYNGPGGDVLSGISPEDDAGCRTLILANCDSPNLTASDEAQSASAAEGSVFIDQ